MTDRPRLLDLFCGAGGCARGYAAAGWAVTGVDLNTARLRHYPYPHHLADALAYAADHGHKFDAIHASPPCQAYSITRHTHSIEHPDLLPETRALLRDLGRPFVIENVPGAPMPDAMILCGTMFGLTATDVDGERLYLRRHRLFESDVFLYPPDVCHCAAWARKGLRCGGVYGGGSTDRSAAAIRRGGYTPTAHVARELMGLDIPQAHLTQAIPPAYTEHIGAQLIEAL